MEEHLNQQYQDRLGQPYEPPLTNITSKKANPVSINPLDYGFIVTIGCQSFAVTDIDEMMNKLKVYLENPRETEILWFENKDITLIK